MAMFRRRPRTDDEPEIVDDAVVEAEETSGSDDLPREAVRTQGPWDSGDDAGDQPRVDLGALRIPGVPGMELRMEIDKTTNVVSSASVTVDGSTLQLQAYAAPAPRASGTRSVARSSSRWSRKVARPTTCRVRSAASCWRGCPHARPRDGRVTDPRGSSASTGPAGSCAVS